HQLVRLLEIGSCFIELAVNARQASEPECSHGAQVVIPFVANLQRRANLRLASLRIAAPRVHYPGPPEREALLPPIAKHLRTLPHPLEVLRCVVRSADAEVYEAPLLSDRRGRL